MKTGGRVPAKAGTQGGKRGVKVPLGSCFRRSTIQLMRISLWSTRCFPSLSLSARLRWFHSSGCLEHRLAPQFVGQHVHHPLPVRAQICVEPGGAVTDRKLGNVPVAVRRDIMGRHSPLASSVGRYGVQGTGCCGIPYFLRGRQAGIDQIFAAVCGRSHGHKRAARHRERLSRIRCRATSRSIGLRHHLHLAVSRRHG